MRVLITGAQGFVGKNLQLHLAERSDVEVLCFTRDFSVSFKIFSGSTLPATTKIALFGA